MTGEGRDFGSGVPSGLALGAVASGYFGAMDLSYFKTTKNK